MKKIISVLLLIIMVVASAAVPAYAEASPSIYGDVDGSGIINSADALLALQYAVSKITLNTKQLKYGDVNVDKTVTANDALLILQYSVQKIPKLPTVDKIEYDLIIDKPESLLNNGAYEEDLTADCSFQIDTTGLADNTIYLFTNNTTSQGNAIVTKDCARFVTSLQGLINRDFGVTHTSLLYYRTESSDQAWLNYMMEEGNFYEGYNTVVVPTFDDFMQTFKAQIEDSGIILWDPAVPSTANVAATICGLDGYLPVQYDTGERSFYNKLIAYRDQDFNIEEKQSLVGLFTGEGTLPDTDIESSGSTKCDAYLWALEKYMDRCSTKDIAYIVDGAVSVNGNPLAARGDASSPGMTSLPNHDYLIARRCFFFDLTCYKNETPCDDPNQSLGTDSETMMKILDARYKRANGDFGQILGFPPWWLKYTTHGSLGSLVATTLEWMCVEYMTAYNVAKEADAAQPCSMTNGSVYYKYVSDTEEFVNNEAFEDIQYDPNTYYYLIYMGDYDSSAWLKLHVNNFWSDTNLGALPLMWSFNPNLSDRVPMIFDYVYEKKTNNDFYAAGEGAGYIIPSALYEGHKIYDQFTRTKPDGDQKWAEYSKPYYEVLDMGITGFIINGNTQISKKIVNLYNSMSPVGSFHNSGTYKLLKSDSTYYVYLQNGIGFTETALPNSIQTIYNHATTRMSPYKFSALRTVCASPRQILNIVNGVQEYAAARGKTFKYVDPYTYFRLIDEAGVAPDANSAMN